MSLFESNKPIVLNIGCGNRKVRDFFPFFTDWKEITLDLYVEDADIKSDIVTLTGVPDNSVDCIWASHVVEHQFWHELPDVFGNIMRVMKPDGFAVVRVPDLAAVADRIKESLLEPIGHIDNGVENGYISLSPIDFIFGARYTHVIDGIGQVHKTGFTPKSMSQILTSLNINFLIREVEFQVEAILYKENNPINFLPDVFKQ